jgi:hypothetical protein
MTPTSRPQAKRSDIERIARKQWKASGNAGDLPTVVLVGVRGYYLDSMGKPGENDRGIYDDAIFVLAPDTFVAFNANTDPSSYRKGRGTGAAKGMASLDNGTWLYTPGPHPLKNGYPAFRQHGPVTVTRDGDPPYKETGNFGINIHKGGNTTTSSEGCQTIPPAQWSAFHALLTLELKKAGAKRFHYILINGVS